MPKSQGALAVTCRLNQPAVGSFQGVEGTLKILDEAAIDGDLKIRTGKAPSISENAAILGETVITAPTLPAPEPKAPVRTYIRNWLVVWCQFLVVGLGFRLILPGRTTRYLNNLHRVPALAAILGPVYWLLVLAGGALALAAAGTATAGLIVIEFWDLMPLVMFIGFVIVVTVWGGGGLLGFVLGPVLTAVWFCRTLLGWLPGLGREAYLLPVLLGTGLVGAAVAIPTYGWIVWLVAASLGSGAFLTRSQAEPPPAANYASPGGPPLARTGKA